MKYERMKIRKARRKEKQIKENVQLLISRKVNRYLRDNDISSLLKLSLPTRLNAERSKSETNDQSWYEPTQTVTNENAKVASRLPVQTELSDKYLRVKFQSLVSVTTYSNIGIERITWKNIKRKKKKIYIKASKRMKIFDTIFAERVTPHG